MTETAYEKVTHALSRVTQWNPPNDKGDWLCPAHDDRTPSLSVNRGNKGVVITCQAGCETKDVVDLLGLTMGDLFDEDRPPRDHKPEIVATYDYTDEEGQPLYQVVRFEPKDFRQRRRGHDGEWQWSITDTRRVLYRLPRVIEAVQRGFTIYVVEGEKDVHAIEGAGGTATCNSGGAGKWRDEYSRVLAGAEVVVVADKDGPGRKHAHNVQASIECAGGHTTMVEARTGKDPADHLGAGHTLQDLRVVGEAEPELEHQDDRPGALDVLRPFHRIDVDLTATLPATPLLPPWIYGGGCLTILQSEPGVGKSWLALWVSVAVMLEGFDVVYIDEEGGLELVHERLRLLGADPALVREHFWYYAFETRTWGEEDMLATAAMLAGVPKPGLAILDSLPDFLAVAGQDEDRAKDVTSFIKKVCGAFREVGCSQLLLDHLPKPAAGSKKERSRYSRGSGSKLGKADATLLLETGDEFDVHNSGSLKLWKTKDRRGRLELPNLGKPGYHLTVTVSGEEVDITYQEATPDAPVWDGPTECMNAVLGVLTAAAGTEFSQRKLVTSMRALGHPFRDETIREAAERLALKRTIRYRKGPRGADLYSLNQTEQTTSEPLDDI